MDVSALRWFQLVADGFTVTEVSDLEMASQPTVSRALGKLSSELGAPLLRRDGRVLRLTRAGVVFKRHVDAVLHHLDDGLAAVAQLADPESGVVSVAFLPSLGSWLVPRLAAEFGQFHPRVQLDLVPIRDETRFATSSQSDVDMELTALRPPSTTHHWCGLLREPIRVAVADDHPLATSSAPIGIGRLSGERIVTMRSSSLLRHLTDDLMRAEGVEPEVAFVVDDLPSLFGYVAAGLGVALAPERSFEGVTLRPLETKGAFREVGLVWPRDRRLLPSAELFRAFVEEKSRTRGTDDQPEQDPQRRPSIGH